MRLNLKTVSQDLSADNSWDVKEENGENHVGSMDHDVLAVSMVKLHSAQEAIEREVQKLKDVGKEDPLFLDDSIQPSEPSNLEGCEARLFEEFQSGETSNTFETQTILKQNLVQGDLKTEVEEILKQRIEVEVQYIAISEAIQQLKAGYIDQIELMVQQKKLALEHMEVMKKLESAESKARELKREAEKLKVTCEEILEREEVLKEQNRAIYNT
ncbi:hypothetical protein Ccrd_022550 [Cynara cardunculus var. scolymus]|uniref:Uncharacterized protein n=1 Tax=Cynara cardunculus var. scolymus TaxID=59895 RepID=A0A103XYM1_CYNCS|nr:hypothetical protein Ccrd_022550 [Cynara cardunculus var. scolymus]